MTALRHWTLSLFSLLFLLLGTPTHAGEYITFLHSDPQGSPIMATDEQGNVVWQEEYEPWGARQVKDTAAATAARGSKVWYTGKEEEAALGMYYYGARWYSPDTGQFASVDPMPVRLGNPRSFNRYVYANNNPIVYVDPDGRDAVSIARTLRAGIMFDFAFPDPSDFAWPKILIEGGLLLGTNYIIDRAGNNYLNEAAKDGDKEEAKPGTADSDEGCIYCVKGEKTRSGKDYVGSTDDIDQRKKDKTDGRDREGAEIVDTYPKGDKTTRRAKEQQAINDRGGVGKLDNKRNEVTPSKWPDMGVTPP